PVGSGCVAFFFFQAEDGIRDRNVTGVQTCALPISAVVVLLMRRLRAPEPGWALGWLGLEATAHALIVRPSLALAHALARFDDQVVDRSLNALAGVVPVFARGAARVDYEGIDRGVEVIAGAVP